MNSENAVLVFTKWPRLLYSKTRVAKDTSDEFARKLAVTSLDDLMSNISSDYYDILVGVNKNWELEQFKERYGVSGRIAEGETQSDKFYNLFSKLLNDEGYKKVLLIPSDLPFMQTSELIAAFARLEQFNFVFGPETNGGTYCIGIKGLIAKNIFSKVGWSSTHTFKDLTESCKGEHYVLQQKEDINTFQDILNLREKIKHTCPKLYTLLKDNGYYAPDVRYVNFDDLQISIPIAMAIVERGDRNDLEILVQTRFKPTVDKHNTGKLEVPSGLIEKYEPAYLAAVRETEEETGICIEIQNLSVQSKHQDDISKVIAYTPFCCVQQVSGGRAYVGFAFVGKAVGGKLQENISENRNPRFIPFKELAEIVEHNLGTVFPLNIPALKEYVKSKQTII